MNFSRYPPHLNIHHISYWRTLRLPPTPSPQTINTLDCLIVSIPINTTINTLVFIYVWMLLRISVWYISYRSCDHRILLIFNLEKITFQITFHCEWKLALHTHSLTLYISILLKYNLSDMSKVICHCFNLYLYKYESFPVYCLVVQKSDLW